MIGQMVDAVSHGDWSTFNTIKERYLNAISEYCEHGHHKYGACAECDEIERILMPENLKD